MNKEKADEKIVRVLNVPTKKGITIRVATIEQNGRKEPPCKGCSAPCCKGSLIPVLTEDELQFKKFPFQFIEAPEWLIAQVPRAQYLAVLKMGENGCEFFDSSLNICKIFPNCPKSCLSYDCREDSRMDEIWKNGELKKEVIIPLLKDN